MKEDKKPVLTVVGLQGQQLHRIDTLHSQANPFRSWSKLITTQVEYDSFID